MQSRARDKKPRHAYNALYLWAHMLAIKDKKRVIKGNQLNEDRDSEFHTCQSSQTYQTEQGTHFISQVLTWKSFIFIHWICQQYFGKKTNILKEIIHKANSLCSALHYFFLAVKFLICKWCSALKLLLLSYFTVSECVSDCVTMTAAQMCCLIGRLLQRRKMSQWWHIVWGDD